jgi:hypothetical protein
MLRRLFPAIIALTFPWAFGGCPGFNHYEHDQPPPTAKEAEKWWTDKFDSLDLDFLAALCAASDIHKRHGTTATYAAYSMGRTMAGMYFSESRLPLPLPESAAASAKARLAVVQGLGWKPTGDQPSYRAAYRSWRWEGGNGCSAKKAEEIWREAENRFGWKPQE